MSVSRRNQFYPKSGTSTGSRSLEHELAVSLGLNPPALPITQPSSPHLAACTPEEAAQVLSLIQGMLPVVNVFFELAPGTLRMTSNGGREL